MVYGSLHAHPVTREATAATSAARKRCILHLAFLNAKLLHLPCGARKRCILLLAFHNEKPLHLPSLRCTKTLPFAFGLSQREATAATSAAQKCCLLLLAFHNAKPLQLPSLRWTAKALHFTFGLSQRKPLLEVCTTQSHFILSPYQAKPLLELHHAKPLLETCTVKAASFSHRTTQPDPFRSAKYS